jgi:pimeloyl-ACP methyl ester carboxylesterase
MQILRALWEQRPSELYAAVRCPVLLLPARRDEAGERERRFIEGKTHAVAIAESILRLHGVRVDVSWFDDSIHDIPLQRPAELAACLEGFAASLVLEQASGA